MGLLADISKHERYCARMNSSDYFDFKFI